MSNRLLLESFFNIPNRPTNDVISINNFYTVFAKLSIFGSPVVLYMGVNYSKKKYDNELKLARNK